MTPLQYVLGALLIVSSIMIIIVVLLQESKNAGLSGAIDAGHMGDLSDDLVDAILAEAGRFAGRQASWFPSYGPEQRGGSASCTVVVSGQQIGSPDATTPDVLVCMNRPAFERFAPTVRKGGLLICDAMAGVGPGEAPEGVRMVTIPASELAEQLGVPRAANTVMLAALSYLDATGLPREKLLEALDASFVKKPKLIPINRKVFEAATEWCRENIKEHGQ